MLSAPSDGSPQILELPLIETSRFSNSAGPDSWDFRGNSVPMETAAPGNLGFAFRKSYLYLWVSSVASVHVGEHREDASGMQTLAKKPQNQQQKKPLVFVYSQHDLINA